MDLVKFLLTLVGLGLTESVRVSVPGLDKNQCYFTPGDLIIGVMYYIHKKGTTDDLCSDINYSSPRKRLHDMETFAFALKTVNARQDILPNISLGLAMFDDCAWDIGALAKAMYFTPMEQQNGTLITDAPLIPTNCSEGLRQFPIIGFTGVTNSRKAVMISPYFSVFHIPIVSYYATSDELSDKSRYEYFMRISPPDRFQVDALLDFAEALNWTYISVIYSEGSFGENGARLVEKGAKDRGICIGLYYMVESLSGRLVYDRVVEMLRLNAKARAVILFLTFFPTMELLLAVERHAAVGEFIWLGSDAMSYNVLIPPANGSFVIHPVSNGIPSWEEYSSYLGSLTPVTHPENAWIYDIWEEVYNCTWKPSEGMLPCYQFENKTISGFPPHERLTVTMDAIDTFAYGIDNLIKDNCPEAHKNKSLLSSCVQGNLLLKYLMNVTFEGRTGTIKFDENGDMFGRYMIKQHIYTPERNTIDVALWDRDKQTLSINHKNIEWSIFNMGFYDTPGEVSMPRESLCSKPCGERTYAVRFEVRCCWECRTCRNNEIIVNSSRCEICQENTWPDPETSTECLSIVPDFLVWSEGIPLGLSSLALLGLIAWLSTVVVYTLNWSARLIKASSRELSLILLVGILLAYIGVFAYLMKPDSVSCQLRGHIFNIAVVLIYAPLLMKTNRVYRIFSAGRRGTKAKCIGSGIQLFLTSQICLIQVIVSTLTGILIPTSAKQRMPIPTKQYVELYCYLPVQGLLLPLSVNLILLCLCAVYGFLTRKLPENFNESWYIFVSVSTTAFVWLVFLPTYFTTFYAYHQAALMAFCLILNASVTLLCLYLPKIYAIYFVEEEKIVIGTVDTTKKTTVNPLPEVD